MMDAGIGITRGWKDRIAPGAYAGDLLSCGPGAFGVGTPWWRAVLSALLGVLLGGLGLAARGGEPGIVGRPLSLNVALVRSVFSSVNANDAEAAFKVFCASVGRRRGYQLDSRVQVFDSEPAFRDAVVAGTFDLVIIDTFRFVHLPEIPEVVQPRFSTSQRGSVSKRYVLLTHRPGPYENLEALRGREVLVIDVPQADIGRPWLEALLAASGMGNPADFFQRVRLVAKPSAAVLPVFFGKSDACVVDEVGFDLMKEMNPQVGAGVRVIAQSEPVVHGLILVREKGWAEMRQRQDLMEALRDLHEDPAGMQLLTLFKTERLVPFEDNHLDGARGLRALCERARPGGGAATR